MRAFIVMCLVAATYADKLGYNYQPVAHSDGGLSFAPGSGSSLGGGSLGGGILGGGSLGGAFGGISDGGLDGSSVGLSYEAPSYTVPAAEYEKEFYSFSAPEGEFDDGNAAQRIAGSVKKGLRVVFIKGPENRGLEDAALALARQASDQKTAIYVLNKQADIGDLANRLNAISRNSNNKPEVHFVKYRTPEDAANAQQAIRGQYDSLGGSSQSYNGGVAPVLNFASKGPVRSVQVQAPGASYLPSSIFRRRV